MIAIDWTLGVSALVFLITLVALNRILFRPLFEVLEQRKAATVGAFERAEGGQELYQSKLEDCEDRLRAERQSGYQRAEAERKETLQQRQAQIAETRSRAETLVAESRATLEEELGLAREQLSKDAQKIALSISERILSR